MEYLTAEIELVLPTFKSWTVHKITVYLTLGLLSRLFEISITVQQLTFLTHPVDYFCQSNELKLQLLVFVQVIN